MAESRTVLVVGPAGVGKTALIRRFSGCEDAPVRRTIGFDENAGEAFLSPLDESLPPELRALLPANGILFVLWEIGGSMGGHLRQPPRGRRLDGLVACYSVLDRGSFHAASHRLFQHRADRHFEAPSSTSTPGSDVGHLPVLLCGTRLDEVDAARPRVVDEVEAQSLVRQGGAEVAMATSAKTGERVRDAFCSLAAAILRGEAHSIGPGGAGQLATVGGGPWGLRCPGVAGATLTSPRGQRPLEPGLLASPASLRLVEALAIGGAAALSMPRTAASCLDRGLLHRAVHVWLCNVRVGGICLRRYSELSPKFPWRSGPTCCGDVHCYGSSSDAATGPHTAEMSATAAARCLREQLDIEVPIGELELWASCENRSGTCNEMLDVFVVDRVGDFRLPRGDEAKWTHYLDVFGQDARGAPDLIHVADAYRGAFLRKMRERVAHDGRQRPPL